jgi:hypothetical protein
MLSVATVKNQSRILLNEATAAFWLDADFTAWCTLAATDISSKTLCYERVGAITLVAATQQYPYSGWSPSCLKILGITVAGIGLKRSTPWMDGVQTAVVADTPEYFWEFASNVGLTPVPTVADVGKITSVFYADCTSDITLIPDRYLLAATMFVTALGFLKERQYQKGLALQQQYMAILGMDRQEVSETKSTPKPLTAYTIPVQG